MREKIWIKRFNSFKDASEADINYHLNMTPEERLETMEYLREVFYKLKGYGKGREGLRRVFKIVKKT
ncbi:MAG: hypothetical protein N2257_01890 [Thermodesulfovibrionales bacterium]|nr:hypothetical protein [Thermodesulfovibrionales bacterium]